MQKAREAKSGQVKTWILLGAEAFSLAQTHAATAGLFPVVVWVHSSCPGFCSSLSWTTAQTSGH